MCTDLQTPGTSAQSRAHDLAHLVENMNDGYFFLDHQWIVTTINARGAQMMGKTAEEMLGRCLWEIFPTAVGQTFWHEYHRAVADRAPRTFEAYTPRIHRWFLARAIPMERGLAVFYQDITEKKVREEEIRASEERLRLAAEASGVGTFDVDLLANRVTWPSNPQIIFGPGREIRECTLAQFFERIHPEDRDWTEREVTGALASRSDIKGQFRVIWPDGSVHWVQSRGFAYYGADGRPYRMIGTNLEVTEQLERERALAGLAEENARLVRELQEAVRTRDEFLSIASHELKTPLTSLKLQTQIRQRALARGEFESFTPDRLRRMLESDARQVVRLTRLIDDMLDISRISSGRLAYRPERFDLAEMVADVTERIAEQAAAAGCELRVVYSDSALGSWDRTRIEQVFLNLLTNAIRYGGGKPIEVHVWRDGETGYLAVRDEGVGIAEEDRERIFQRFERAATPDHVTGLGLGLYIAREIIQTHGGRIRLESRLGEGSVFTVELPLLSRPLAEAGTPTPPPA